AKGRHLITVQTEHPAVLEPCRYLEKLGFEVTYLTVDSHGLVNLADLAAALRPETILVSIMAANNEIGVLQPLAEIGQLCRQQGVLLHTDAAQALGKIPLDVEQMNIDLLSMTAHKVYGPKGIGALYLRRQKPRVQLAPQIHGGGQERNLRSGTLATPQIVGLAKAVELALAEQGAEQQRLRGLRNRLGKQLQSLAGIHVNGHAHQCLPGCLSVSIEEVEAGALLLGVQPYIAVSSGSACASAKPMPSHVLLALGHSATLARATLRFGLGRWTTEAEVDQAAVRVIKVVSDLRAGQVAIAGNP
ncbi:MAG: cysteine desulfurase, partial [Acaryochloridaceae cyanobacterium CSU_5_19]|nr:cysteine desulfurase [Acaryochloridaceae cyanobacterium CSU_5_19]